MTSRKGKTIELVKKLVIARDSGGGVKDVYYWAGDFQGSEIILYDIIVMDTPWH